METEDERITRNWDELLQELRVTETGIQVLTGFLFTVPFTNRFSELDDLQRNAYLIVLAGSVLTTGLVIAPAAFHRVLFRHRERRWLVDAASRCARIGLVTMALTTSGVLFLAFDFVAGGAAGWIALGVALTFFASLWWAVPRLLAHRH